MFPTSFIPEFLESRVLLSAEIDDDDVLRVNATERSDTIVIRRVGDEIVVTENGKSNRFDLDDVRKLMIRGREGDDSIDCRESPLKCKAEGGDDDDTIYGSNQEDRLLGDNGEDVIKGNKGNDTLQGGDDNDTVKGGAQNDEIDGNDGRDKLFGDDGDDMLWSDDDLWGDDVTGGAGNDRAEVDDDEAASDDVEGVEDVEDD